MSALFSAAALAAAQIAPVPQVTPPPVAGQGLGFVTGRTLFDRCTEDSPVSVSYCFAYIAAVYDSVRAYEIWLNIREFCPVTVLAQSDLRDVFIDYARKRPADLRGQGATIVLAAFKLRYPCSVPLTQDVPQVEIRPPEQQK